MLISHPRIARHLEEGGRIQLRHIYWAHVELQDNQLWWVDNATNRRVSCVESYIDVISKDWEIIHADSVHRSSLPETVRSERDGDRSPGGH